MKQISILFSLFFIPAFLFVSAAACTIKRLDSPELIKSADFIVVAQVVGNNVDSRTGLIQQPIEVIIYHKEVIKGSGVPPTVIQLANCGSGGEVGENSLILIEKVDGKWIGKASAESIYKERFPTLIEKTKSVVGEQQ